MPIYMSVDDSSTITPLSGYDFLAEVRAGSDGDPFGAPEYNVGDGSTSADGRITWDGDLEDGLDSSYAQVKLDLRTDGSATWGVQGSAGGPVTYSGTSFTNISQIKILSAVATTGMHMEWGNVEINFYRDGTLLERSTILSSEPLKADTTNGVFSNRQRVCTITSDVEDFDQIVILGRVHLLSNEPNLQPEANDIFGQIAIYS